MFGEQVQLFFYTLFYDYFSSAILVVITVVLLLALKRRRDWEVRLFAFGNALFLVGVVGRLINGQMMGASSPAVILTARDALIQIGWTFVGFTIEIAFVAIIIGMRFLRLVQLSSTNAALNEANTRLEFSWSLPPQPSLPGRTPY